MISRDYKQLIVWQKSMDLTMEVYSLVKFLPKEETYVLSDQMRRAAVSVPSNIAEGRGRNSDKDFLRFLSLARGSLWELATQVEICERLHYIDSDRSKRTTELITEISKMIKSLSETISPTNNPTQS